MPKATLVDPASCVADGVGTQRTEELRPANKWLRNEAAERRQAEEALNRKEAELRRPTPISPKDQRPCCFGGLAVWVLTEGVIWSEELYRSLEFDAAVKASLQAFRAMDQLEDLTSINAAFKRCFQYKKDLDRL